MARAWAIAFLACNKNPRRYAEDASWRYRAENLALALAAAGHRVACAHLAGCPPRHFDLVVLHRPLDSAVLRRRVAGWRRAGTRVMADFDDLVFEPALAPDSPGVLNRQAALADVRRRFAAHRAVLAQVDAVSVSTDPLRDELLTALADDGLTRPVHLLPNAVHQRWRGLPATPWPMAAPAVGYFSGTHSHDRDLAVAAAGLATALRAHPAWRLQLVGRGDFVVDAPPSQVLRRPRLPFDNGYTDALRATALALLPLEATRFNRCKSALKLIEAGWWNVPVLASPLPDAQRFAGPGLLTVGPDGDWAAVLAALMADPAARARHAHGWRERVLAQADIHRLAQGWSAFVQAALAP